MNSLVLLVQAEISDEITDTTENETISATFTCQAIGEPVPTINWYFNGMMINVYNSTKYVVFNSFNETVITSLLTIVNVQSSDVGTYTCHAENIIGFDQKSGVLTVNGKYISYTYWSFWYNKNVADAAEILRPLIADRAYIVEGNNITLTCVGAGYPPPLVQWSKANGSLSDRTSTTSMSMLTNEGNVTNVTVDLIFTGTYRDDTGVYECSVSNLLNDVATNTSLVVQCTYVTNIRIWLHKRYILM